MCINETFNSLGPLFDLDPIIKMSLITGVTFITEAHKRLSNASCFMLMQGTIPK